MSLGIVNAPPPLSFVMVVVPKLSGKVISVLAFTMARSITFGWAVNIPMLNKKDATAMVFFIKNDLCKVVYKDFNSVAC